MSCRGKRIHYYVMQGEEDTLLCHAGGRGYIIMAGTPAVGPSTSEHRLLWV